MTSHGFELLREAEIPELNTRAKLYRHLKTGAELLSLENDDENKSFGITFRTPVADSTGVPHIIEHSVLGGSRKYPVKEPFVELIKGSLKTFVNAFTYPDRTCYPVASTNLQDFYNLLDVYLDAVFYPLLTPEHLQQEGWHYELNEPDGTLAYRGIVFNEMKGAYSAPEQRVYRYTVESLFPDNTYHFSSGGDPGQIPALTYAHFKGFYETYYHPGNALIYFSGDDDPTERLRRVDAYLREYEPRPVDAAVALQPRFAEARRATYAYPIGREIDPSKKGMVTVSWLLEETTDAPAALAYAILSYLLVGTPAAPLRKALIDSGLGEDVLSVGVDDSLHQMWFSVGLKGIAPDDADKVEALVVRTLGELVERGIERDLIDAAVNTIEFRLREYNTGGFPRGLAMMLEALSGWLYGADPIERLAFEAPLAALKGRLAAGESVFEGMVRRAFLENAHRTTVILRPDPDLAEREEAAEKARLAEARSRMSPEQLAAIADGARRLKERQETPDSPEALATIPRLTLADLDRREKPISLAVEQRAQTPVLYHDLATNGIVYLDIGFDLHTLPRELVPYVPLFGRALTEMGTEKEDFVALSHRIGRDTGGIRADVLDAAILGSDRAAAWLFLRGKAVLGQEDRLLGILRDVLLTLRLDNRERFRQMVLEQKARQESALVPAGNSFVRSRLAAHFREAGWIGEQLGGISNLFFTRQLARAVDEDWPKVLAALEAIRSTLLRRGLALANVTVDAKGWEKVAPALEGFLAELPDGAPPRVDWSIDPLPAFEGLTLPAAVNYVGKGANLYDLGYTYDGSAEVVTRHLARTWIWDRVRVKGGAYGGSCGLDRRSGLFAYTSYRDPNLLETLAAYDEAPRFLRELNLDQDELTKAIIGTISDIDAYRLPDAKGWVSLDRYLTGVTDEDRQRLREQVLDTTAADFRAFGDVLASVAERGEVVVLGGAAAIEKANQERGGWLTVTNVGV